MPSAHKTRVLVLDADMVPALTIARSLARRGCLVHVASQAERPLASYSNAVAACFRYPNPLADADGFIDWVLDHTGTAPYDLVIPVTERTLVVLSASRDRLAHVRIAMPAAASLEVALDKAQTMALADELEVPRPRGFALNSLEELEQIRHSIRFPLVLKPARSIGAGAGGVSQLQVGYAFDQAELEAGCAHALRFGTVLLQEYFTGVGVGIELIARAGVVMYAFQHRRLHEVPLTGGGSSLRKSEPVMDELLRASERLISRLDWNGVAMVEFKLDPATGEFSLMEINGRFWGSLPLAVVAGADFPSMLLDLELDDEVVPCPPYRHDVYCRLLSRDLAWYEAVIRGGADSRIVHLPSGGDIARELGLFFRLRHYFDVQCLRDPVPGLVDMARILKSYRRRLSALSRESGFYRRQKRAWRGGSVTTTLSQAQSVLFLCYGNINRSTLADVMLRAYAEDAGIRVFSAGFHEEEGRPADAVMTEIAGEFGTDLTAIRSTRITPELLRDSDIIFVMEKTHYDRVLLMDPGAARKMFLLGAHPGHPTWPAEIEDPYGRARVHYERCYQRVAEAVEMLKAVIADRIDG